MLDCLAQMDDNNDDDDVSDEDQEISILYLLNASVLLMNKITNISWNYHTLLLNKIDQ